MPRSRFSYKRARSDGECSRSVLIDKGGVVGCGRASRGKVVRSVRVRVGLENNVK
jgi:hypothetical protein